MLKHYAKLNKKKQKKLYLGNIYAKRDWGHAEDYVVAMWKILQQRQPEDFVIATGRQYSIRQFISLVSKKIDMPIFWKGKGLNEKAYDKNKNCIIECKKKYFRPAEVDTLKGDYSKARRLLKWKPENDINSLIDDMISYDLDTILK